MQHNKYTSSDILCKKWVIYSDWQAGVLLEIGTFRYHINTSKTPNSGTKTKRFQKKNPRLIGVATL